MLTKNNTPELIYNELMSISDAINSIYFKYIFSINGMENEDEWVELKQYYTKFDLLLNDLFTKSNEMNFYWEYCPFSVYKTTYETRKQVFLSKFIDSKESDYILLELKAIKSNYKEKDTLEIYGIIDSICVEGYVFNDLITYFISKDLRDNIKYSQREKQSFLELVLKNKEVEISEVEYDNNNPVNESDKIIQVDRIVFMHELGVLDFLREKMKKEMYNLAPHKLAKVIALFTGMDQGTIQSYINPIYSPNVDQGRNPLTAKKIKKIRLKLIEIGFTLDSNKH